MYPSLKSWKSSDGEGMADSWMSFKDSEFDIKETGLCGDYCKLNPP